MIPHWVLKGEYTYCPYCQQAGMMNKNFYICPYCQQIVGVNHQCQKCPKCDTELTYDEVDIGVGTIKGNFYCPGCGWTPEEDIPKKIRR